MCHLNCQSNYLRERARIKREKNRLGFASSWLQVMARQHLCQAASAWHAGFTAACFLKHREIRLLIIISR